MARDSGSGGAGYSGTPLAKKLGIKPGSRVALVGMPRGFEGTLAGLAADASVARGVRRAGSIDVIVWQPGDAAALRAGFNGLADRLTAAGGLWVVWPKKASGIATDLSDGVVRAAGLDGGLVDNKVCAVSETLSGLRFVRRRRDRGEG